MADETSVRESLAQLAPVWGKGSGWGAKFLFGIGVYYDAFKQALYLAANATDLNSSTIPTDALSVLGKERLMPAYPSETQVQHQSRLLDAWDAWAYGGSKTGIESQFTAAGYTGTTVYRKREWPARGESGYWSEFWVFIPIEADAEGGSCPVVGESGLIVGDTWVLGSGLTPEQSYWFRWIVKKWKPARWRCPSVIIETSGWTIGTGHTVGETGLTIGGTTVKVDCP